MRSAFRAEVLTLEDPIDSRLEQAKVLLLGHDLVVGVLVGVGSVLEAEFEHDQQVLFLVGADVVFHSRQVWKGVGIADRLCDTYEYFGQPH